MAAHLKKRVYEEFTKVVQVSAGRKSHGPVCAGGLSAPRLFSRSAPKLVCSRLRFRFLGCASGRGRVRSRPLFSCVL